MGGSPENRGPVEAMLWSIAGRFSRESLYKNINDISVLSAHLQSIYSIQHERDAARRCLAANGGLRRGGRTPGTTASSMRRV